MYDRYYPKALDHPVIRNMERTGTPDGKAIPEYRCPVCDRLCNEYYVDIRDNILGCNECLYCVDAEDFENGEI